MKLSILTNSYSRIYLLNTASSYNLLNRSRISAKLYEAAAAEMAAQEESNSEEATDDGVVDADFEVVDED